MENEVKSFNFKNHILSEFKSINIYYPILMLSCVGIIASYGRYRCNHIQEHKDILEFDLFKNSSKYGLDGWSISHFSFFCLLGILYPNTIVISMTIGIIWELMETYVGLMKPKMIKGFGFCDMPGNKYKVWWYGKWSDPIVNFIGFLLGKEIHKLVIK